MGPESPRPERQERRTASEEVTEVGPNIYRCELPISLPGLGHVNCYAIEDGHGVTLVDPGLPDPGTYQALQQRLGQIGIPVERVHTVLVTHSHPDHFGGAGRFKLCHHSEVVAHEQFATLFDPREDDTAELHDVGPTSIDAGLLEQAIIGDGPVEELPPRSTPWGGWLPLPSLLEINMLRSWDLESRRGLLTPEPTRRVADNEMIRLGGRDWQVIHTPGHTGDHLCLADFENGLLLSGDHILPTITPHISGLTPSADSLADFFGGLERIRTLEGIQKALPAHGDPFTDVAARAEAIALHHDERLALLTEIGHQIGTANVETFSHELFQERSWGPMAESETYAHLEHLHRGGHARRERVDGLLFYTIDS